MAESYRHQSSYRDEYNAIIYLNRNTGRLGLVINIGNEDHIREYWKHNEEPDGYVPLEIRPIKNKSAYLFHNFYNTIPKKQHDKYLITKKFDFYKYVFGADLSPKYRGAMTIHEVKTEEECNKELDSICCYR